MQVNQAYNGELARRDRASEDKSKQGKPSRDRKQERENKRQF